MILLKLYLECFIVLVQDTRNKKSYIHMENGSVLTKKNHYYAILK